MQLSQFKTFNKYAILIISILFGHIALAGAEDTHPAALSQKDVTPVAFDEALKTILSNKKRPSYDSLTVPNVVRKNPELQLRNMQKSMGGSSDGGGNAVGNTLFDFYENQGTLEVTVGELISLEPLSHKILDSLDDGFSGVDNIFSGGLGGIVAKALSLKKIYLENKPITSEACINQSMVTTSLQKVVACQSDLEVRFNVSWLRQVKPQDRAGLILHEMLLAWARTRLKNPKDILEQKVRIANRMIFDGSLSREALLEYFDARAYTKNQLQKATEIALAIKSFQAANIDLLRELSNEQAQLILNGIRDGGIGDATCEYFVQSLQDLKIYPALQQAHLATPGQLCFAIVN